MANLTLNATNELLQIVTVGTPTVTVMSTAFDALITAATSTNVVVTPNLSVTAGTNTVVAAPASTYARTIKSVYIHNTDASNAATVTVQKYDGTTGYPVAAGLLPAGYTLVYEEGQGWYQIDSTMNAIAGSTQSTAASYSPSGLTGSTVTTRWVGGTTSGAPTTGAHNVGDWCVAQNGKVWQCTVAGTPGTWVSNPDVAVFRPIDYAPGNTYDPTGASDSSTSFAAAWTAAQAYSGHYVFQMSPGTFKVATWSPTFTSTQTGAILGAGMYATVLTGVTTTSADFLPLAGNSSTQDGYTIQGFSITNSTPQTSGNALSTSGGSYVVTDVTIRDVFFLNMYNDVLMGSGTARARVLDCYSSRVNAATGGVGILVTVTATNTDILIDRYQIVASGTNRPTAGINLQSSDNVQINNCLVNGCAYGFYMNPGAGGVVSNTRITGSKFTNAVNYNVLLNANSATATIQSTKFTACLFNLTAAGGNSGVYMEGTGAGKLDGTGFTNCVAAGNVTHGWQIAFGTGTTLTDCEARGNSTTGSGTDDGVNIASGITNVKILGGKYGGTVSAPTGGNQRYGINFAGGASVGSVIGADLIGNVTGPINIASTALVTTSGCIGLPIMPVATAPATALVGGTNTYFGAMSFPALQAQAGTCYVLEVDLTSSSATSDAVTVECYWGTLGTTSDQAILSQALTALTALGVSKIRVGFLFSVVGATTTIYTWLEDLTNAVAPQVYSALVNTTSKTTSACFAGIGLNAANSTLAVSMLSWTRRGDRQ